MKNTFVILCALFFVTSFTQGHGYADTRLTILKDGGGAELMENSLIAMTLAVAEGADLLELPVNLSSDDQLIVFRDTTLNRLTDVAHLFPERNREDGNYYVVDFSVLELRQLRLRNVFEDDINALSLGIPTLKEALTVVRALNGRLQKNTGVVVSLVQPGFYTREGKNIGKQLKFALDLLSFGSEDKLYIESADPDELQKISRWTHEGNGVKSFLIQSIELEPHMESTSLDHGNRMIQHRWLFTNSGLRILASYASAVAIPQEVFDNTDVDIKNFLQSLHNYDIKVFAKTSTTSSPTESKEVIISTNPGSSPVTYAEFDGIYVDSLNLTTLEQSTITQPLKNDPVTGEESALPPFFSNLGLSQPKSGANAPVFDNDSNEQDLE